ncbi:MAG TPA: hypothetical protein VKF15_06300 [Nitrososphaerales archaeon]|nr:hypothetical protein [Nitrososphaerales archaeon]
MTAQCRKCKAPLERPDIEFCPKCGTPTTVFPQVEHKDAIDEFTHHESVLQNYRSMFLVSETFSVSLAATQLGNRGLVLLFAAFGVSLLVVWILVTTLRAKVVEFFEEHDEDGMLMQYHNLAEGAAHRAGYLFFTLVLPTMFALFWLSLILLAFGVV